MTNIFLQLAVSVLVWAPVHVRAAQNPPAATCQALQGGGQPTTQIYKMPGLSIVRITCPGGTTLTNGGQAQADQGAAADVYPNNTAAATVKLNTLLLGASYVQQGGNNDFTVSQLPVKSVTIYFRCEANANPSCWIGVEVPAQGPLGPQGCAVGGSEVTLRVTGANQTAQFICATGTKLFPETAANVYDSDCKTEVALTSAVPGGQLNRSQNSMNSLTVSTLPSAAKSVCLICAARADAQDNLKCKIKVNVSGEEKPNGGVAGVTARTATAFGVLLVGATLSQCV